MYFKLNHLFVLECPTGFLYAGEVPEAETRGEIWIMGETSPVYSCYNIQKGDMDWVAANQKWYSWLLKSFPILVFRCFEQKGQLLSVNNNQEEAILTGEMFLRVFMEVGENATEVLTSGISLKEGNWTWFGAG